MASKSNPLAAAARAMTGRRKPISDEALVALQRQGYRVDAHGIIRNPGKFEGEPAYVPEFWEAGLDGGADRDDGRCWGFDLSAADKAKYPGLLKGRRTIRICQDDQGFVRSV